MASNTATVAPLDARQQVMALLATDGSAGQPALARIGEPRAPLPDLADALHCLCLLHGNRPGTIDIALERARVPAAGNWLADAATAFAGEREWLARLVAALGPIPSTANQTVSESTIVTQRHALEMLALSDRSGCALGAATALVLDWQVIRTLLDRIGERLGLDAPHSDLTDLAFAQPLLDAAELTADQQRAFHFGAQQLLAQQRGLWMLIDARAEARIDA